MIAMQCDITRLFILQNYLSPSQRVPPPLFPGKKERRKEGKKERRREGEKERREEGKNGKER